MLESLNRFRFKRAHSCHDHSPWASVFYLPTATGPCYPQKQVQGTLTRDALRSSSQFHRNRNIVLVKADAIDGPAAKLRFKLCNDVVDLLLPLLVRLELQTTQLLAGSHACGTPSMPTPYPMHPSAKSHVRLPIASSNVGTQHARLLAYHLAEP